MVDTMEERPGSDALREAGTGPRGMNLDDLKGE